MPLLNELLTMEKTREQNKLRKRKQRRLQKEALALARVQEEANPEPEPEQQPEPPECVCEGQEQPEPEQQPEPQQPEARRVVIIKRKNTQPKKYTADDIIKLLTEHEHNREKTRTKHVGEMRALFRIIGCSDDFVKCLSNFDKVKHDIDNAKQIHDSTKEYGIDKKKDVLATLLFVIDKLKVPFPNELRVKYKKIHAVYLEQSRRKTQERKKGGKDGINTVRPFLHEILPEIKEKYGVESKEYLVALLYKIGCMRDDYGGIIIINRDLPNGDDTDNNYLYVPRGKGNCKLVIQKYKTDNAYRVMSFAMNAEESKIVRNYITRHKIALNTMLFPSNGNGLSSFVSNMLKDIGITNGSGVNYLRHSIISEQMFNKNYTDAELVELAYSCAHSVQSHLDYVRPIVWKQ